MLRTELIKNIRQKIQTKEFEFEACNNGLVCRLIIEEHGLEFIVGIYNRGMDVHAGMRGVLAFRLDVYYKEVDIITTCKTLTSWEVTTALRQTREAAGEVFDQVIVPVLSKK